MCRSGELPDNQSVQWPTDTVAESILQYIEIYKINAVVTFDKYGVSRHKNHISLYFAIAALCIEKKVPPCQYRSFNWRTNIVDWYNVSLISDCKLYVLESVNIIRKYIQVLDLPVSLLSASYWYLVTYEQKRTIKVNQNILLIYITPLTGITFLTLSFSCRVPWLHTSPSTSGFESCTWSFRDTRSSTPFKKSVPSIWSWISSSTRTERYTTNEELYKM